MPLLLLINFIKRLIKTIDIIFYILYTVYRERGIYGNKKRKAS